MSSLKKDKYDVVFLQETHMSSEDSEKLSRMDRSRVFQCRL